MSKIVKVTVMEPRQLPMRQCAVMPLPWLAEPYMVYSMDHAREVLGDGQARCTRCLRRDAMVCGSFATLTRRVCHD